MLGIFREFYRAEVNELEEAVETAIVLRSTGKQPTGDDSPEVHFIYSISEEEVDERLEGILGEIPRGARLMSYEDAKGKVKDVEFPGCGLFAYDEVNEKLYTVTDPVSPEWSEL